MYNESEYSISLMKLNVYYQDMRYSNKKYMKLFNYKQYFKRLYKLFGNILCVRKQGLKHTMFQIRAFLNPGLVEDYRLEYSFNHSDEIEYKPKHKEIQGKIAVYTAVFGDYDPITQPLFKSSLCDYYAITDQELTDGCFWKKYDMSRIQGFEELDDYHKSKYCKMFPHVLFPDYEYSIWIDGNVQIIADVVPLVDRLSDEKFMGAFKNPLHDCIYTEAKFNLVNNYVKGVDLQKQVELYRSKGFPPKFGMREFSIIVRCHNDKECIHLMQEWWHEVNTHTMRDQISFPYILWRNEMSIDTVQLLGEDWRWNPRFMWHPHNWHINYIKSRSGE